MIRVTLFGSWTASAAGITVDYSSRRRGAPLCALARRLVEAGHDPADELRIFRCHTLCLRPATLGKWAGLVVEEGDNTRKTARFARYRPPNPQLARETDDSGVGLGRFTGHFALSGGHQVPERGEQCHLSTNLSLPVHQDALMLKKTDFSNISEATC